MDGGVGGEQIISLKSFAYFGSDLFSFKSSPYGKEANILCFLDVSLLQMHFTHV